MNKRLINVGVKPYIPNIKRNIVLKQHLNSSYQYNVGKVTPTQDPKMPLIATHLGIFKVLSNNHTGSVQCMCTTLGIFDLSLNLLISATPCSPMMDDCIRVCNSHIIKGGPYQVFTQLMYTCTRMLLIGCIVLSRW